MACLRKGCRRTQQLKREMSRFIKLPALFFKKVNVADGTSNTPPVPLLEDKLKDTCVGRGS